MHTSARRTPLKAGLVAATGLGGYLKARGVKTVDVTGLASDMA
jgi:nicotinamidase-related amidase